MLNQKSAKQARTTLFFLPALVLAVLAFAATPALAARGRVLSVSLGSPGSAAGELEKPEGVAVNEATHDVYVADTGNHRVDEFEADGTFIMAFGKEVGPLGEDTCTALSTCKAGVFGSEPGEFEGPASIALDNAPGGEGDVYVADTGTGLIQKFTAQGKLERSWAIEGQLTEAPAPSVTADLTAGSDVITATSGQFLGEFFTAHKERAESPKEQQEEEERGEANWVGGEELVGEGIPAGTHIKNCPSNTRCELYNPTIKKIQPATETRTGVAITAPSRSLPEVAVGGVAVDSATGELSLYSAEPGLNVLQFERDGGYTREWHAQHSSDSARSIAIDGAGDVYLSYAGGVLEFTSAGAPLSGGCRAR